MNRTRVQIYLTDTNREWLETLGKKHGNLSDALNAALTEHHDWQASERHPVLTKLVEIENLIKKEAQR